CQHSYGIPYNF
nr:immunoglobulin light chain junction region [Macaca mulatta]